MSTRIKRRAQNKTTTLLTALLAGVSVCASAQAATYYVDDVGSNGNGSSGSPFNSIQAGANAAQAGDTVIVRGGTYRETVTPPRNGTSSAPITFQVASGETATVNGCDVVGGWSQHSGNIYKAPMSWTRGDTEDQIFVNGQMMIQARWPNPPSDLDPMKYNWQTADSGWWSYETDSHFEYQIIENSLPFSAYDLVGARVHIIGGWGWVGYTAPIKGAVNSTQFKIEQKKFSGWQWETYAAADGDNYYIFGKLNLLDIGGEWYRDPSNNTLYLYKPGGGSPSSTQVEAKRRDYGFNLSGRSYINLKGLNLFATSILTSDSSSHCAFDGLNVKYVSHFMRNEDNPWLAGVDSTGLILKGSNHTLKNSEVSYSAGQGVYMTGSGHTVTNNKIHHVNYNIADCFGVMAGGSNQSITFNTISYSTRGLVQTVCANSRINNNEIHHAMLETDDGGATYCYYTDGQNTEIAYNVVHSVRSLHGWAGNGIYLDNYCRNFRVHHNIVYDTDQAMRINPPNPNTGSHVQTNIVANNTLIGRYRGLVIGDNKDTDMGSARIVNNILATDNTVGHAAFQLGTLAVSPVRENNLLYSPNGPQQVKFRNWSTRDLRLASDSPAINYGKVYSPYTDGYVGSAPDAGAIEYDKPMFAYGAGASTSTNGTNLVSNPSFDAENYDTQTPSGWSEVQYDSSWNTVTPNASYTEAYGGSASGARHGTHWSSSAYRVYTYQVKTGLANGLYTLRAKARSGGGQLECTMVAKNYGGTQKTVNLPVSSTYQTIEIKDINVTNSQCEIGFWSSANAGNWCYFDDVEFFKQSSGAPTGSRIALRAKANNKYVCADNAGSNALIANRDSAGTWESFDVVDGGSGVIGLRALANNRFVSAMNSGSSALLAQGTSLGSWEQFNWLENSDGTISLKALVNNKIVCADNAGASPLIANRNSAGGDWEKFQWLLIQ